MTAETVAIVVGVILAAALVWLLVFPRRDYERYDVRREVWRFRTSAGRFRAALVLNDWRGRCYAVSARYRDGRTEQTFCAPAEAVLRRHIDSLTTTYRERP